MPEEYCTIADLASILRCSVSTVRRKIRSGSLPVCRVGPRTIRIERAALAALRARPVTIAPQHELFLQPPEAPPAQRPVATERDHVPADILLRALDAYGTAPLADLRAARVGAGGDFRKTLTAVASLSGQHEEKSLDDRLAEGLAERRAAQGLPPKPHLQLIAEMKALEAKRAALAAAAKPPPFAAADGHTGRP